MPFPVPLFTSNNTSSHLNVLLSHIILPIVEELIVGQSCVFPVDISPGPAPFAVLSRLFALHDRL